MEGRSRFLEKDSNLGLLDQSFRSLVLHTAAVQSQTVVKLNGEHSRMINAQGNQPYRTSWQGLDG